MMGTLEMAAAAATTVATTTTAATTSERIDYAVVKGLIEKAPSH